ncbi:MAG: hypothetical protein IRY94_03220 [Rhodospirillaceae bacterium]|nr:hypothetical protein [Rhodospirillaceae bacterium]
MKALRLLSLLLVALTLGLAFAHVMEFPGKLRFDGPLWLTVQQNLYVAFGVAGAGVEVAAILSTWLLVPLVRRRPGFYWTLAAAISITVGLGVWFALVSPMNTVLDGWTPQTLPQDWTAVRNQWEFGHAVHCVLFLLGFGALAVALLVETPDRAA